MEGEPTAESYTWDFPGEASELLASVESSANSVADLADRLRFAPTKSREYHISRLMEIRAEINDLGDMLCRLQIIRRAALPWQQEAIDRALPQLQAMVSDAENAILFVNENPRNLFNPTYREYASSMYDGSRELSSMVSDFQEYGQAKSDLSRLEQALGLTPVS